ncbi:hypothetical protein FAZ95_23035 [Trinickia violacea]|uniref:Uncharacterized protein n=1 Tax=Trinickia violacea TaxID=2571746 RepID=A0A4P8ISP0_9BURK|nr:hypothetical protein [Trinickia violacea]QCP52072.1 hypothetical protein FAZ95_23035 [Trinickia violacea]
MLDALESVSKAHTGLTTHFLSNTVKTSLAKMGTETKVSIGTGVAVAVGVTIASIATGGLALGVLIGLGAGSYLLKNIIEKIGAELNRPSRNWLKNFPSAKPKQDAEMGAFLTVEASDSLRRAVDHFRMMKTIGDEIKNATTHHFVSCEDAINYAKAVSRFIHHSDKVRNYTLPSLDLLIFYLGQYEELTKIWGVEEAKISAALQTWFENHGDGRCCPHGDSKNVCYATSFADPNAMPFKRHAEATRTLPASFPPVPPAPADANAVLISEILADLEARRAKIIAGMHASNNATRNYSADRLTTMTTHVVTRDRAGVSVGGPVTDEMHVVRLNKLLDAVWRQVDRPGYFVRAARRAEHWYTRRTRSEKAGALISELLAVGSIFVPFVGEANALTKLGQSAISSSITTAVLVGDKVGLNLLKGSDGIAIRSNLLAHELVEAHATTEIREAAAGVEKVMSKLMLHFGKAAKAIESIQNSPPAIESCNDAMAWSTKVAEIVLQMEKVSRYAGPCVGMVHVLTNQCYAWTEAESDVWWEMESNVAEWLRTPAAHEHCRIGGTKCYGPKHHLAGANFLGRGGTWVHLTNDPHSPLT